MRAGGRGQGAARTAGGAAAGRAPSARRRQRRSEVARRRGARARRSGSPASRGGLASRRTSCSRRPPGRPAARPTRVEQVATHARGRRRSAISVSGSSRRDRRERPGVPRRHDLEARPRPGRRAGRRARGTGRRGRGGCSSAAMPSGRRHVAAAVPGDEEDVGHGQCSLVVDEQGGATRSVASAGSVGGAVEAAVAAQLLPGVDVGGDDEQVDEASLRSVRSGGTARRRSRTQSRCSRRAAVGDPADRVVGAPPGRAAAATPVAALLVVVDDHVARRRPRRRRGVRRSSPTSAMAWLRGGLDQAGPAAEPAEHGLHADAGPVGDVVEGDVGEQAGSSASRDRRRRGSDAGSARRPRPGRSSCTCASFSCQSQLTPKSILMSTRININMCERSRRGGTVADLSPVTMNDGAAAPCAPSRRQIPCPTSGVTARACHSRQAPPHRRGQDPAPARRRSRRPSTPSRTTSSR